METQNRWGFVLLASGFAILAVAVAGATYFWENRGEKTPAIVAVPSSTEGAKQIESTDWKNTLASFTTNAENGLPPTDALGIELSKEYEDAFKNDSLTPEEQAAALSQLIAENVPKVGSESPVTLSELSVRDDVQLETYAQLVLLVLRESEKIREYELVSFDRAVREGNHTGIPELKEAATTYKRIKNALVVVEVPSSVAHEHLALVNGVGSLARIVSLMGNWNGDPITGLTYLDSFISAEAVLESNVDQLFTRLTQLS